MQQDAGVLQRNNASDKELNKGQCKTIEVGFHDVLVGGSFTRGWLKMWLMTKWMLLGVSNLVVQGPVQDLEQRQTASE